MKNDTKSIVRCFSDCRLDTYCGMLGAAADAEKNAFFLIAQPMKSSITANHPHILYLCFILMVFLFR